VLRVLWPVSSQGAALPLPCAALPLVAFANPPRALSGVTDNSDVVVPDGMTGLSGVSSTYGYGANPVRVPGVSSYRK